MFFPLGLSNFWVGAWFPFDEGQFTARFLDIKVAKLNDGACYNINVISYITKGFKTRVEKMKGFNFVMIQSFNFV